MKKPDGGLDILLAVALVVFVSLTGYLIWTAAVGVMK
jgi:hypothetical protein